MSKSLLNDDDIPKPEEEAKSNVQFKFLLIGVVIIIVLLSNIAKGKVSFSDFMKFDYSFSLNRFNDSKEYILFFIIIIPLLFLLYQSNRKWEQEAVEKYLNEEERKAQEEEKKKQEEFEAKMRGVHFKAN